MSSRSYTRDAKFAAKTYTVRQRMAYEECGCDPMAAKPPNWLLDKIADDTLTGGFRKSDVCPDCRMARSVNGTCGC
jgi:hypothetical protein